MNDILLRADNSTYNHLDKTCLDPRAVLQQYPVAPGTNYFCSQATAGNFILLIEILCWELWVSQVQSRGLYSMFLEHIFGPTSAFPSVAIPEEATDYLGRHSVVFFSCVSNVSLPDAKEKFFFSLLIYYTVQGFSRIVITQVYEKLNDLVLTVL